MVIEESIRSVAEIAHHCTTGSIFLLRLIRQQGYFEERMAGSQKGRK